MPAPASQTVPKTERRTISAELSGARIERRQDDDAPDRLAGYGAVYYDGTPETEYELWTNCVERIMPGAFDRAVREDDVRGLFNHDRNLILGRVKAGTMRIKTDKRGLWYEIDVPDTQPGRDTATSVERGDVTGSSFSFYVKEVTWRDEGDLEIREINDVELFDTGPVTFPAYEGTTSAARGEPAFAEVRAELAAWRDNLGDIAAAERAGIAARARARRLRLIEIEAAG